MGKQPPPREAVQGQGHYIVYNERFLNNVDMVLQPRIKGQINEKSSELGFLVLTKSTGLNANS